METFIIPAAILVAISIVNRVVEMTVKPLVKQVQGQFKFGATAYRLFMTLASIIVGIAVYLTTPDAVQAFDETLFAATPTAPFFLKALFAGISLWVGADFIRPIFEVTRLIKSVIEQARAAADATNTATWSFDSTASSQVVRNEGHG